MASCCLALLKSEYCLDRQAVITKKNLYQNYEVIIKMPYQDLCSLLPVIKL